MSDRIRFEAQGDFLFHPGNLERAFPEAARMPRIGKHQLDAMYLAFRTGLRLLDREHRWNGFQVPVIPGELAERKWGEYYTLGSLVRRDVLKFVSNTMGAMFALETGSWEAHVLKDTEGKHVNGWLVLTEEGLAILLDRADRDRVKEDGRTVFAHRIAKRLKDVLGWQWWSHFTARWKSSYQLPDLEGLEGGSE